jgi:hypothetical protein
MNWQEELKYKRYWDVQNKDDYDSLVDFISNLLKQQRDKAAGMATAIQSVAMRYNTVVSTEALHIEIEEIFNSYFPEGVAK